jgi:hypothetical protein
VSRDGTKEKSMTESKKNLLPVKLYHRLAAAFVLMLIPVAVCSAQQSPPQLEIASPTDGTIVNPGQTLSVTVTSPANVAFTQVGVQCAEPLSERQMVGNKRFLAILT